MIYSQDLGAPGVWLCFKMGSMSNRGIGSLLIAAGHIDFGYVIYCLVGALEHFCNWAKLWKRTHKIWKINFHSTSN